MLDATVTFGPMWKSREKCMTSPSTAEGTKRKAEDDEEENATEEHHDILEETRARAEADHARRRSQR